MDDTNSISLMSKSMGSSASVQSSSQSDERICSSLEEHEYDPFAPTISFTVTLELGGDLLTSYILKMLLLFLSKELDTLATANLKEGRTEDLGGG